MTSYPTNPLPAEGDSHVIPTEVYRDKMAILPYNSSPYLGRQSFRPSRVYWDEMTVLSR